MKEYNRQTKRWEDKAEVERKTKRRAACKGGRPHDWVAILPPFYAEALENYKHDPEPYYQAEIDIAEFTRRRYQRLADEDGIKMKTSRWLSPFSVSRYYVCAVCKKQEYYRDKKPQ